MTQKSICVNSALWINHDKAMKFVGHSDYQTITDIYTHLDQEMLRATADDMAEVFKTVTTAARKNQIQRPSNRVIRFPKTGS